MADHYASPVLRMERNRKILESGKHLCLYVFPTGRTPDEFPGSFTYTVGLFRERGYELLVFALPAEMSAEVLNHIVEDCPGTPAIGVNDDRWANLPTRFQWCDPKHARRFVVQADAFAGEQVPVLQVVLPDADGLFPEDEGFNHEMMDHLQPLVYRPQGEPK